MEVRLLKSVNHFNLLKTAKFWLFRSNLILERADSGTAQRRQTSEARGSEGEDGGRVAGQRR